MCDNGLNITFAISMFFFVLHIISLANNKVLQLQMVICVYTHAHFRCQLRINLIYMHCLLDIVNCCCKCYRFRVITFSLCSVHSQIFFHCCSVTDRILVSEVFGLTWCIFSLAFPLPKIFKTWLLGLCSSCFGLLFWLSSEVFDA